MSFRMKLYGDILKNFKPKAMEIINIIDKLKRTGYFRRRLLERITHIAVHHSASPMGKFTPYDFARWHTDPNGRLKAPGICYHFSITGDGKIYQCNELEALAWHACDANIYSIGVELDGNFENEDPTSEQIASLLWLVNYLNTLLGKTLIVKGHRELPGNSTACPGKNMMAIKDQWQINNPV
jgi:N-acetylmuramoyl-L-alanine amidase